MRNMKQLYDQRWNMNFNNSKYYVTNKGKEVLMKKVIFEKDIKGFQDTEIDKVNIYE